MGVVLLSHLSFNYLLDQDSSSVNSIQLSARDRAVTVRESAKLVSKDIRLNEKPISSEGARKGKEGEETDTPSVDFPVYGHHWGNEAIPQLRNFSRWADEYVKSPQRSKEQMERGVQLAKARREIMLTLIEMDPEAALASAIPRDIRLQMPREVIEQSERRIDGIGNLSVKISTPQVGTKKMGPLITRSARINQEKYRAYVYGQMENFGTTSGLYLHGVAVDKKLALAETPMRPLEVGESLVPNRPVEADHSVGRRIANQIRSDGAGPFFVEGKGGYSCLCCKAANWDNYDSYLKATVGDGVSKAAAIGRAYNNTGAKKLLLIPVEFPDKAGSPWSTDAVRDSRISDIQDFFNTSSYSNFTLPTVDAATLQTMDNNASYYAVTDGEDLLRDDAVAKALTAGWDKNDYEFVSIVINHNLYSSWGGLGQLGSKYTWIDGYDSGTELDQWTSVYTHELGHNLGLWHANAWDPTSSTVADDSNGSHVEYGHDFDVMGDVFTYDYDQSHYNASFKNSLDWLPDSSITTLDANSSNVTLDLHVMDQTYTAGRVYAVKIDAGITLGSSSDLDYWIEFRSRYPSLSTLDDGVIIYTSNDAHSDEALKLLDMNPGTSSVSDAGLDSGETFTTANSRWTILVNPASGTGADRKVSISITDARAKPFITRQPESKSQAYGTSISLSVSAGGTGLSYQWYQTGTALSGETSSTLTISDFEESHVGDYYVIITNTYGSTTSDTVTLSKASSGGGGGGCGSVPPVNLILIGWFSLLFSRLCFWFNFGVKRPSIRCQKPENRRSSKWKMPILLLMIFCILGGTGCTSIESRAMGTEKPFPGIRYLNDPRHSMYGDKGALVTKAEELSEGDQAGCFWIEALELSAQVPPDTWSEEACKALVLIGYWPVDFVATLSLDTVLWPFDALDKHALDKKDLAE